MGLKEGDKIAAVAKVAREDTTSTDAVVPPLPSVPEPEPTTEDAPE
jgi:hypothetical protein